MTHFEGWDVRRSHARPAEALEPAERGQPGPAAAPLTADSVLLLQRSAGNAAVQRALAPSIQRKEATGSGLGEWLFGPTEGEENDTGASPSAGWRWLSWAGVSTAQVVAQMVEVLGFEGYGFSSAFLKHYMGGRGADYEFEMPATWQETIASKYKKKGSFKDVNAYNWGIPDMKNSLGHFDLKVEEIAGGGKLYTVTDKYHFPATVGKGKAIFHGFEVDFFGMLPVQAQKTINDALAALGTWKHPSGKLEKFEIVPLGGKWTFIIPQQWLIDSGVDFHVHSSFIVDPGGAPSGDDDEGWF